MEDKKICPLMSHEIAYSEEGSEPILVNCLGSGCGWWLTNLVAHGEEPIDEGNCAIADIAEALWYGK